MAPIRGAGRQRWRPIAIDDLIAYLVDILDEPASYGGAFDVGTDELVAYDALVDAPADALGRPHPHKVHLPLRALRPLARVLELVGGLPSGGVRAGLDHLAEELSANYRYGTIGE